MTTQAPIILPAESPPVPAVYLDWNLVQYLRQDDAFGPLLQALVEARSSNTAIIPYSIAHMMDATAGWTSLKSAQEQERLRNMIWLDGLAAGAMGEIERQGVGHRYLLRREPFIEACRLRGHMYSLDDDDPDGQHRAPINERVEQLVEATVAKIRQDAAPPSHMPPGLAESMIDAVRATYGGGVSDQCQMGTNYTAMMAPWLLHTAETLPNVADVPPAEAMGHLERCMAEAYPGFSVAQQLQDALDANPTLEPDVYGPMMLWVFGYQRERARDLKRAAPGIIADLLHGQHALAAAIFLTSDRRLARRLQAWAAYTGRGFEHGQWPVILQVKPGDEPGIERATEVVNAFCVAFVGYAGEWRAGMVPLD